MWQCLQSRNASYNDLSHSARGFAASALSLLLTPHCSVTALSPLLALSPRFRCNGRPEHDGCGCDVLMDSVMLNLQKELAE